MSYCNRDFETSHKCRVPDCLIRAFGRTNVEKIHDMTEPGSLIDAKYKIDFIMCMKDGSRISAGFRVLSQYGNTWNITIKKSELLNSLARVYVFMWRSEGNIIKEQVIDFKKVREFLLSYDEGLRDAAFLKTNTEQGTQFYAIEQQILSNLIDGAVIYENNQIPMER